MNIIEIYTKTMYICILFFFNFPILNYQNFNMIRMLRFTFIFVKLLVSYLTKLLNYLIINTYHKTNIHIFEKKSVFISKSSLNSLYYK